MPRDYQHSPKLSAAIFYRARGSVSKERKYVEKGMRKIFLLRRSDLFFNKIARSRWYFCRKKGGNPVTPRRCVHRECPDASDTDSELSGAVVTSLAETAANIFSRGLLKQSLYPQLELPTHLRMSGNLFPFICLHMGAYDSVSRRNMGATCLDQISY